MVKIRIHRKKHMKNAPRIRINEKLKNQDCHVLTWPKRRLERKFHDAGTFGETHTYTHTRFMFYK